MSVDSSSKTAFITGASSGLGAEFARQLASRGYDLVITARREAHLHELSESLQSTYGIRAQVLPADLSKLPDIERLSSFIGQLSDLEILVNNAGFGTVGRFYQVDAAVESSMVNLHVMAPVILCRAALPGMLSRSRGTIINVSSLAGLIPIRNVVYHSTKAFLVSFSEALRTELRGKNVRVQALCPGFMLTEFHQTIENSRFPRKGIPRFLWMTPEQVASSSLKSLRHDNLICIPGAFYRIAGALARNSLSASIIKFVAGPILHTRKSS